MGNHATELKWGGIFFLTGLVWMGLERAVGLHDAHIGKHAVYTNFFVVPAIAVYVLALLDKRRSLGGSCTYKQGFFCGLLITAVATLLSPLSQYLTSTVITPGYFGNAIEWAVAQGKMKREEAEAFFKMSNYIVMGLIGAPIMGIATSAIVAAFTRTRSKA